MTLTNKLALTTEGIEIAIELPTGLAMEQISLSSDVLNIQITDLPNQSVQLSLYNLTGQLIYQKNVSVLGKVHQESINVHDFPSGFYVLSIMYGVESLQRKVIVR